MTALHRHDLPQMNPAKPFLVWTGMETDLIFNRGIDVPGFAAFPLLENPETRALILEYYRAQIRLAAEFGTGTILESTTWMANPDRAAPLGYGADGLAAINRDAIALMAEARAAEPLAAVVISANVGPRGDGYDGGSAMPIPQAEAYHRAQIAALADTDVDVISAYTMTSQTEASGIVRACAGFGLPVVVAFTVETDGRLPDGQPLADAIAETDAATGGSAAYFMVNCAHPDHFTDVLGGSHRLKGIVVNASRCSHAELDEAETLDDGNPEELGAQIAALARAFPAISVVGGCCGTDLRHLREMAQAITEATA